LTGNYKKSLKFGRGEMNTKKLAILSCIFLFLLSSPIFAAEGIYISGGVGASIFENSEIEEPGSPTVETGFKTGLILGAAIGYDFGIVRVEGQVGYLMNDIDEFTALGVTVDGEGDVNAISFLVNGFFDIETKSPFTPYFGGGIGIANVDIEVDSISGGGIFIPINESADDTVFAFQLGAGVGYAINESVTLDFSYRFIDTTSELELEDFGPDVKADFRSHNFLLGVRYSF
jgi:opacity protein-like surface antigen